MNAYFGPAPAQYDFFVLGLNVGLGSQTAPSKLLFQ
jgi:hypothetical protein